VGGGGAIAATAHHRGSGPPWTGLHHRLEELTRARPTGAPVHESSVRLYVKDEELARVQSRASPEVEE
jgi:predicted HAD superfamily Cof-like phosphohydrolase